MSEFNSTHYSTGQKIDNLIAWAIECADLVKVRVEELGGEAPVFCYRGMSGVAHATALAQAYYQRCSKVFGMIYVRKEGEYSHGRSKAESTINTVREKQVVLVFVDDLISGGATRNITLTESIKELTVCWSSANIVIREGYISVLQAGVYTDLLSQVVDNYRPMEKEHDFISTRANPCAEIDMQGRPYTSLYGVPEPVKKVKRPAPKLKRSPAWIDMAEGPTFAAQYLQQWPAVGGAVGEYSDQPVDRGVVLRDGDSVSITTGPIKAGP